jgi:hypothetical protein
LSHVEDPNANVPAGPPLVTTKEPDEKEDEDEICHNVAIKTITIHIIEVVISITTIITYLHNYI